MGNAPLPEGLLLIVRGAEVGGGITIFVWVVKFIRSVGESLELRGLRGVASSSSLEDVLCREEESNRKGRWPVVGVLAIIDVRNCLDGDHASGPGCLDGEFRKLANRVMSVGIAEIVLKSPTVSS